MNLSCVSSETRTLGAKQSAEKSLLNALGSLTKAGVPHISLVFREIWDAKNVDHSVRRMNRESEGRYSGVPHLAKPERDMGHPAFVKEPGSWTVNFSRRLL